MDGALVYVVYGIYHIVTYLLYYCEYMLPWRGDLKSLQNTYPAVKTATLTNKSEEDLLHACSMFCVAQRISCTIIWPDANSKLGWKLAEGFLARFDSSGVQLTRGRFSYSRPTTYSAMTSLLYSEAIIS